MLKPPTSIILLFFYYSNNIPISHWLQSVDCSNATSSGLAASPQAIQDQPDSCAPLEMGEFPDLPKCVFGDPERGWNGGFLKWGGFPRSSMLIRVSFIKQPFGGTPMTMGTSKWLVEWLVNGWLCCHLRRCYHTDLDMIPVVFPWHREAMKRSNAFQSGQGVKGKGPTWINPTSWISSDDTLW